MDLALEIGTAYLKVARVQGVPINSNLGQFKEAAESLSKADAFVETVLASRGFRQRTRALLTSAEIARDAMILAQSEYQDAKAVAFGSKAAERLDALMASPGFTPEEAAAAAGLYVNLALTNCNLHHLEEATGYARRAVEISRAYDRDERHLGRALGVLSNTARFAGDLNGALEAIRGSRAIAQNLARADNAESMLQLGAAFWREGLILGELNTISFDQPREAEPFLQRALEIAEALARKDPDDYSSRSYVSMAGRELGDILRETSPKRALAVYDQARRRVGEIKGNSKSRRDEVWLLTGSAYALRRQGRPAEARQRIDAALSILQEIKDYPAPKVILGDESDAALRALGDHYADTGEITAAIQTYEDLHERVLASKPQPETDLRHANGVSRIYRDLANLYVRTGRVAEAKVLEQRRTELWRYWDRKLPENVFVRRQLEKSAG
jgi:tetratricopeptide (TPR) repeat protein